MFYEYKGFIPVVHLSSFVHPQASVTGNVIIGRNVYIGPGAALRGDWGALLLKMVAMCRRIVLFTCFQA
jgi:carbonic anhydrase/acetyltransferase-like protein (isoleucine patch superfamily)